MKSSSTSLAEPTKSLSNSFRVNLRLSSTSFTKVLNSWKLIPVQKDWQVWFQSKARWSYSNKIVRLLALVLKDGSRTWNLWCVWPLSIKSLIATRIWMRTSRKFQKKSRNTANSCRQDWVTNDKWTPKYLLAGSGTGLLSACTLACKYGLPRKLKASLSQQNNAELL